MLRPLPSADAELASIIASIAVGVPHPSWITASCIGEYQRCSSKRQFQLPEVHRGLQKVSDPRRRYFRPIRNNEIAPKSGMIATMMKAGVYDT